ncbi:hypothetical protein APSETT444_002863 [Aspergillus pseudonomiae]
MPGYTWNSSSTLISEVHLNRLVDILDNATRVYSDEDLDRYGSPLVQALLLISQGISAKLKAHLQALVLPTNKDHERVIEHMAEGEINPVTGQRRDMETPQNTPEMTMEEKEREAERLFVLFQRLQETGVIQVENPLVQAMREGRLE